MVNDTGINSEFELVDTLVERYISEKRYNDAVNILNAYLDKPEFHDGRFEYLYIDATAHYAFYFIDNKDYAKGIKKLKLLINQIINWYGCNCAHDTDILNYIYEEVDHLIESNIKTAIKFISDIINLLHGINIHENFDDKLATYYYCNNQIESSFKHYKLYIDFMAEQGYFEANLTNFIDKARNEAKNNGNNKNREYYAMLDAFLSYMLDTKPINKLLIEDVADEIVEYLMSYKGKKEAEEVYERILGTYNSDKIINKLFYIKHKPEDIQI